MFAVVFFKIEFQLINTQINVMFSIFVLRMNTFVVSLYFSYFGFKLFFSLFEQLLDIIEHK